MFFLQHVGKIMLLGRKGLALPLPGREEVRKAAINEEEEWELSILPPLVNILKNSHNKLINSLE